MNVILCATDAGGVRNLAPLLPVLAQRRRLPILITSHAHRDLFGAHIENASRVIIADDLTPGKLRQLVADDTPLAAIICGTTRHLSPDRQLILLARGRVRTVVVLDEWFNYRHRFVAPGSGELVYLPNVVAVQDERAKAEAAAEGIPGGICHVTGSPALADLTRRAQSLAKTPPPVPEFLRGSWDRPIVTFLSETHATDYGSSLYSSGPLGQFIGYTEITVRNAILEALRRLGHPVSFIEKLHPAAQAGEKPQAVPENVEWQVVRHSDLWPLLWHSDLVIGMRSMALLEANILGCTAISFQPGLIGAERCTAVRLGVVPKLEQIDDLKAWCARHLAASRGPGRKRVIPQYPFATPDAAERVVDLALKGIEPL